MIEKNFFEKKIYLTSFISLIFIYVLIISFDFYRINKELFFSILVLSNLCVLFFTLLKLYQKDFKKRQIIYLFISFLILIFFDYLSYGLVELLYFEIFSFNIIYLFKLLIYLFLSIFLINIFLLIKLTTTYIFFLEKTNFKKNLYIAIKGCLIGASDLVPGISGGSISFILGIYDRWIKAISNITTKNFIDVYYNFLRLNFMYVHKKLIKCDTYFLIFIGVFLFLSIYFFSKVLNKLFNDLYIFIMSFFFGIILFSSIDMYRHTQKKDEKNLLFIAFGFLFVCLIFFFIEPSSLFKKEGIYLFLAGFISLAAMLVPGFSGAYILILLGVYEDIILYISNIQSYYLKLIPFYVGVIFGFFTISKVINFFLTKYHSKTISTLLGLMFGGLIFIFHGIISEIQKFSFILLFEIIFFIGLGFFAIKLLEKLKIANI